MTGVTNLSAELTNSLTSLWTRYAGRRPADGRTEIRGNVVTCQLIDAVGDFNRSMIAPQADDSVGGVGRPTLAEYKRDAVAAVVGVTQQRVTSFISSHDRDSDVATEIFTLEPSLEKGRPRSLADSSGRGMTEPGRSHATRRRIDELTAEAKYARDRYRLYRARVHTARITSPGRLRALERASNRAESVLRRAQSGLTHSRPQG